MTQAEYIKITTNISLAENILHGCWLIFLSLFLFIYCRLGWVFIAACRLSLAVASEACSLVVQGLLIVVASLPVQHRLQEA